MLESFKKFEVRACHDVSMGGLAVCVAEMSFGRSVGFEAARKLDFVELFSESNTRWVVELPESLAEGYVEFFRAKGLRAEIIGYSGGERLDFGTFSVELDEADKAWRDGLSRFL